MKPPPFEYRAPDSLEEALSLLEALGADAKVLAGGQSLIPLLNFRLAAPAVLVDTNRVGELFYVRRRDGELAIGTMTRQATLATDPTVAEHAPLVAEAMPYVAHAQIRNRGTLGGSLAHADPAAELPAVALALGARFKLQRAGASRWIPARDFFLGTFTTALEPDEMLTEVVIPAPPSRSGSAFTEVARRHGDFALAGVAAVVTLDGDRRCEAVRLALLGVADRPVLAAGAAAVLEGQEPSAEVVAAAAAAAQEEIEPGSDVHASAAYRRHLAGVLARRALHTAVERARAAADGAGGPAA